MTFQELSLIEPIMQALATENYTVPTPIQAQAIPILLEGHDLLGCAQTGTGKTAAFSIPIIQMLYQKRQQTPLQGIQALVITPTRELAIQIDDSFAAYGRYANLRHTVIFGGVGQKPQTDTIKRGVDILVATPGRLIDLINQGFISLRNLQFFVLDEADMMLDMGFIHDIRRILKVLPPKRQSLFFSATMPKEIETLASSILRNAKKVEVTPTSSTVEKIEQHLFYVSKNDKIELLLHLLKDKTLTSVLIFTRTKHGADKVSKVLLKNNISAEAIHGNKSQNNRQRTLTNFRDQTTRVLIATDIAARGIDVDHISHVINYELPNVSETYVHRIGRTGRAGRSGISLSFCDNEEFVCLRDIQKLIGKSIPVANHPYELDESLPIAKTKPDPTNRQSNNRSKPAARRDNDSWHVKRRS